MTFKERIESFDTQRHEVTHQHETRFINLTQFSIRIFLCNCCVFTPENGDVGLKRKLIRTHRQYPRILLGPRAVIVTDSRLRARCKYKKTSSSFFCSCQSISSSLNLSRTNYQPALVAQLVESLVRSQQVWDSIPPLDKKNLVATLLSLRDVLKPRSEFRLRQWRGTPSACSPLLPPIFHWVRTCMTRSAREFSTTQT